MPPASTRGWYLYCKGRPGRSGPSGPSPRLGFLLFARRMLRRRSLGGTRALGEGSWAPRDWVTPQRGPQ